MIIYLLAGIQYLQVNSQIPAYTYCCMCHYPAVFLQKYLHILHRFLRRFILHRFLRRSLCAASARLCRRLCSRIAVASPSHRRRIAVASPHRIGAASRRWRRLATCRLHKNYICQWCSRLVARGLKKWGLSSGLWAKR